MTVTRPSAHELARLAVAIVLTGLATGLSVLALVALVHGVEHAVFGRGRGPFLDGLTMPAQRWLPFATVTAAGVVGAVGWYALRRWGRPLASVEEGVDGRRMPAAETALDVALQVLGVALGASIGKEVAPRELAAMVTSKVVAVLGLDVRWRRILIASAAGAGLAAVYNVPYGGAMFALELLLGEFRVATVVPALAVSSIAVLVSRPLVDYQSLYTLPPVRVTTSLLVASAVIGPLLGVVAAGFLAATRRAATHRPAGRRMLVVMPVVYAAVGATGVAFPLVLGNGRSLAQAGFDATEVAGMLVLLAALKFAATSAIIGSGAVGGTLQPSVAMGAALGSAAAMGWRGFWPGTTPTELAVVGAAAFLAATMRAPLTAIALVSEFAGVGPALFIPIFIAVAGALAAAALLRGSGTAGLVPVDPARE